MNTIYPIDVLYKQFQLHLRGRFDPALLSGSNVLYSILRLSAYLQTLLRQVQGASGSFPADNYISYPIDCESTGGPNKQGINWLIRDNVAFV